MEARVCLLDFLKGVLELNPLKRWTPQQALQHPFITQKKFTGPFQPDGYIKPITSTSTGLSGLDTSTVHSSQLAFCLKLISYICIVNKPALKPASRKRSESMGKITAPEQIQLIVQQIHSPVTKYPQENVQPQKSESFTTTNTFRQRNTKSQGDYLGLLSPQDAPKKVKISPQIKVRRGSHDSEAIVRMDGKAKITNIKKSHVGEAAGGFLMMRRDEGKRTISDAFKRRTIKQ
jgi:serine/threonine protein kinase